MQDLNFFTMMIPIGLLFLFVIGAMILGKSMKKNASSNKNESFQILQMLTPMPVKSNVTIEGRKSGVPTPYISQYTMIWTPDSPETVRLWNDKTPLVSIPFEELKIISADPSVTSERSSHLTVYKALEKDFTPAELQLIFPDLTDHNHLDVILYIVQEFIDSVNIEINKKERLAEGLTKSLNL